MSINWFVKKSAKTTKYLIEYLPVFCCASESEVSLPLGGGSAWLSIDLVKLVGGWCLTTRLQNTRLTSTAWLCGAGYYSRYYWLYFLDKILKMRAAGLNAWNGNKIAIWILKSLWLTLTDKREDRWPNCHWPRHPTLCLSFTAKVKKELTSFYCLESPWVSPQHLISSMTFTFPSSCTTTTVTSLQIHSLQSL